MSASYVLARLAGADVAIASDMVEAVVDLAAIVPAPATPPAVSGLSALRSRVVTVVDPGLVLGTRATRGRRAMVVALDGHDYALLVDRVDDVAALEPVALADGIALSEQWRSVACAMALGGGAGDGAPRIVIDLRVLLRHATAQAALA